MDFSTSFWKFQTAGTEYGEVAVFENQSAHEGGDDHVQSMRTFASEWTVGDAFKRDSDTRREEHGDGHGKDERRQRGKIENRAEHP